MKIVRLVLLAACFVAPVACSGESLVQPDTPTQVVPSNEVQVSVPSLNTESSDSTARDGGGAFGSGT